VGSQLEDDNPWWHHVAGRLPTFSLELHIDPVAQPAPMRGIGAVFGTILGIFVLKETQGRRRIMAAGLITAGVILLSIFG